MARSDWTLFNNPIVNPLYREPEDEEPDELVLNTFQTQHNSSNSSYEADDPDKEIVCSEEAASRFESPEGEPTSDFQDGVRKAEAIAMAWGKPALVMTYIGIYCIFFVVSYQSSIQGGMTAYVYSSFSKHSSLNLSTVLSNVIGGIARLPTAKLIDVWGRPQGLIVMMAFMVTGMILLVCAKNVETYVAGNVIYWIGNDGVQYVLDVVIADTSSLRNRALMLAFSTSPYIATAFAGPATAQLFVNATEGTFNPWGFGIFAIILPALSAPLAYLFLRNQKKAERSGLYQSRNSGRTFSQSLVYHFIECDVVGMSILGAAFLIFLLPFELVSSPSGTAIDVYDNSPSLGMILVGLVLFIIFPIYESKIATKPMIPWRLLKDRSLLGGCLTVSSLWVSFYCWDTYFTSFCQVVHGLNVSQAGYMANIYDIGSCIAGIITGIVIRYIGRYKIMALVCVPVYALGSGLMMYFRLPDQNIGFLAMCQVFIAFSGGTLVLLNQIAMMASSKHGDFAIVLALYSLFASLGGAIGGAVSGAIWATTFAPSLEALLPVEVIGDIAVIASTIAEQLAYPIGSPARDAIIQAYGIGQFQQCIAATCFTLVTLAGVWMWRDVRLDNKKQVKGTVM